VNEINEEKVTSGCSPDIPIRGFHKFSSSFLSNSPKRTSEEFYPIREKLSDNPNVQGTA
jgi:hypothetical protein